MSLTYIPRAFGSTLLVVSPNTPSAAPFSFPIGVTYIPRAFGSTLVISTYPHTLTCRLVLAMDSSSFLFPEPYFPSYGFSSFASPYETV